MWRGLLLVLAFILAGCSYAAVKSNTSPEEVEPPLEDRSAGGIEAAPTASGPDPEPTLENLGEAPELTNQVWLNSDEVLRLADLRGKVVLLEMWTFG
jgi:hypothetical protein